ncbi:MAG TPA: phosphoribosylformylglycinamidine synthase subunit PurQ [Bacillota bacterium]|nr:phosphoribosylformylglycinamidine synthase subunit PurQ [Bacillota bacterium]HOH09813.1 phosphoribosylformylglycinamidine synthase subunit PurQ [Bacillota bacterium]HOS50118.1 phosphoribosylformylglycinamidine synthase subunit PurQ [Bacillota bacterium]HOY89534.1 phosphoribosylformylglycinamidine synthase subunit PurQ [Bacillota bacterium]HPI00774.1 phosphoribosylformylglycinamidine synthase subunit PurQ [Bacillota bacterium]
MKIGIVVFPGSNCDRDIERAAEVVGSESGFIWHKDKDVRGYDAIVLPGGFAHGDYLRCGAIARFSPVMDAVSEFAEGGGPVLGICNGFQTLLESGLLPGATLRNTGLRFICRPQKLRIDNVNTPFTHLYKKGEVLDFPIAHAEGNYYADPDTIKLLEDEGRIVFRYAEPDGSLTEASNPNGSMHNIAGITNKTGNVVGLMPHPERVVESILGGTDGLRVFKSVMSWCGKGGVR